MRVETSGSFTERTLQVSEDGADQSGGLGGV